MPAYNSSFNSDDLRCIGNMALLPIKSKYKGPAPIETNTQVEDIIDEAINLYRANCLFKNFEFKGTADRVLVYLIVYISECLSKLSQKSPLPNKIEGYKILNSLALQNFSVPGDPNFPLNAFFEAPTDRNQAELMKQYISQLRQEMSVRITEKIYNEDSTPSKWWMCFSKRKFMGITKSLS
ncbi:ARP2/3 complex 21 kDa subunit [Neocallimastix lanati (nom. inval.)]|jgi:actin related protein 2/3 complex subunit 3|uniref:Actin-related protein 2/3 complex subunit 3 n=1 Tax=Neocallimastix californiae TaxID=1754190 RepID=A0A1Y2FBS8_9FUNG|nr:ARP2/3 complex 21 kDa subunit [Neocallimastix sp. JGI-2020a]ORY81077.1 ARP2/3 complex 21 kDa subunit [Neocallimastix californiae]|eukprot:ORY81077.1 ARP2/3 complex 21 kDa subunit [Neocallimastix californiae]